MIGRNVSYESGGERVTGLVERVDLSKPDEPTLTVAGVAGIKPSALREVQ
jgi:hypothetical protein